VERHASGEYTRNALCQVPSVRYQVPGTHGGPAATKNCPPPAFCLLATAYCPNATACASARKMPTPQGGVGATKAKGARPRPNGLRGDPYTSTSARGIRTPNPCPLAPNRKPPVSFSFSSQGASNGRWSTLNHKVFNFEQTGALWRLIVIMAVPEEIRFVVSLMRTREKRAISIYRAQTASCSSLFIGGLKR